MHEFKLRLQQVRVVLALEFQKLVDQVQKMGRMLKELDFDVSDRLSLARQWFLAADDLNAIHERIAQVRGPDVSGYRGAAPLDPPFHERICDTFPPPPVPSHATIIAADGSQIYPNEQWRIPYYLTNIGIFVYFHGEERVPLQTTSPKLIYHPERTRDNAKRVLGNRTIDAYRTTREILELGNAAWELKAEAQPLIALFDNHLLFSPTSEVQNYKELLKRYHGALVHLHDSGALLGGYVDNPTRSRLVLRLLHLLSLDPDEVRSDQMGAGRLEGLKDLDLFNAVLAPGERSAMMVQNSPRNYQYKQRGQNYEIAFFYIKMTSTYQSTIARIDLPLWVARDRQKVDQLHALLLHQGALQGRNPYPYVLTRADELAVVSSRDKAKLEELIRLEWRVQRPDVDPQVFSAKFFGKQLARSDQRLHEL